MPSTGGGAAFWMNFITGCRFDMELYDVVHLLYSCKFTVWLTVLLLLVSCTAFITLCILQLQDLICEILQGQLVMFDKDSFHSVLSTIPFSACILVFIFTMQCSYYCTVNVDVWIKISLKWFLACDCEAVMHAIVIDFLSVSPSVRLSVRPSVKRVYCDKTKAPCIWTVSYTHLTLPTIYSV